MPDISRVVLIPCRNYEDNVNEKIKCAIDLLGGIQGFVKPDDKILVKPNVLSAVTPDKAVTTHPAVFEAVLKLLYENGYTDLMYGDSPGSQLGDVRKSMAASGLAPIAEKYRTALADFDHPVNVSYPMGKHCKDFTLCKAADDADAIISVCKMKTHALENITGAVKNQYGLVYHTHKAMGHAKYPDSQSFANMIADLDMCVKPKLYIMDGVIAMEGNGPSSGNPVPMNVIMVSSDPVAIDTVFAKLVYLDPESVPTCISGSAAGLGTMNPKEIEIITLDGTISIDEAVEKYGKPDFDVKREKPKFWRLGFIFKIKKKKKDKPVVDLDKCIACGMCQEACPVDGKAVHSGNGKKAEYDYSKCIRCYCCQEMCPAKAITKV